MKTTLNAIREHSPCADGWTKLLRHLGKTEADDEPLSIVTILDSNGIDDALWCLRAVSGHDREIRLYAVWCARQVQHLTTDPRGVAALYVAERYANGDATDEELATSRAAARAAGPAAWNAAAGAAAWVAWDAARAAAWAAGAAAWNAAARAAARAAGAAAWDAARAAARAAAAGAAARAAGAAARAAGAAAWDAARAAARAAQSTELRRVCEAIEQREAA